MFRFPYYCLTQVACKDHFSFKIGYIFFPGFEVIVKHKCGFLSFKIVDGQGLKELIFISIQTQISMSWTWLTSKPFVIVVL